MRRKGQPGDCEKEGQSDYEKEGQSDYEKKGQPDYEKKVLSDGLMESRHDSLCIALLGQ